MTWHGAPTSAPPPAHPRRRSRLDPFCSPQGNGRIMKIRERLGSFALLVAAVGMGCGVPTGLDDLDDSSLVETHQAVVDGVVRGQLDQPLEGVEIVLRFAGSTLPAPTTQTDGSGSFLLVLAMYNGGSAPDSAAATVYAFARTSIHSAAAVNHVDVVVRFAPKGQAPPRASVSLKLPVF